MSYCKICNLRVSENSNYHDEKNCPYKIDNTTFRLTGNEYKINYPDHTKSYTEKIINIVYENRMRHEIQNKHYEI